MNPILLIDQFTVRPPTRQTEIDISYTLFEQADDNNPDLAGFGCTIQAGSSIQFQDLSMEPSANVTLKNLIPGTTYELILGVRYTDNAGNSRTATAATQPGPPPSLSVSPNVLVFNNLTSQQMFVAGGTLPYSVAVSPNDVFIVSDATVPGKYTVSPRAVGQATITIRDSAGHTVSASVTVNVAPEGSVPAAIFGSMMNRLAGHVAITSGRPIRVHEILKICVTADDRAIHITARDLAQDGPWAAWESMGGAFIGGAAAIAVRPGGLETFDTTTRCFGLGQDNQYWEANVPGRSIPLNTGRRISDPILTSSRDKRIDLFGTDGNRAVHYQFFDGQTWSADRNLGGSILGTPSACSWGPGRLDIVGVQRTTDSNQFSLFHAFSDDGENWSGWEPLGGAVRSNPVMCSWGLGRLDIVLIGPANQPFHKSFDRSGWSNWEGLGGAARDVTMPAVTAAGPGRFDVVVVGLDSGLYHKFLDAQGWHPSSTDWEHLGGENITIDLGSGSPSLVSLGPNNVALFVVGEDRKVYNRICTGTQWTGWEKIDGLVVATGLG